MKIRYRFTACDRARNERIGHELSGHPFDILLPIRGPIDWPPFTATPATFYQVEPGDVIATPSPADLDGVPPEELN